MILIKCLKRRKENVLYDLEACPYCGYGIKAYFEKKRKCKKNDEFKNTFIYKEKTNIKKRLKYGYLMAIMCIGLTGCADKTATAETISGSATVTSKSIKEMNFVAGAIETRENATFRNACWGDNKETVKKYEAEMPWIADSDLVLRGLSSFLNKDAVFEYDFYNDALLAAMVIPDVDYANDKDLYFQDYNEIKELLTKTYGEPITDNPNDYWKETIHRQPQYSTSWKDDNTWIGLGPMSWDDERWLIIYLMDINYITNDSNLAVTLNNDSIEQSGVSYKIIQVDGGDL